MSGSILTSPYKPMGWGQHLRRLLLALAVLFLALPARADAPVWSASLGGGYMVLGGKNPTSEWVLSARGGGRLVLTDALALHAGASITVAPEIWDHWAIGLVGADVGPEYQWSGGLLLTASARWEWGRVPLCNDWRPAAICMRYWGWIPGGTGGVGWGGESVLVVAGVTVRRIVALPGNSWSFQPLISGVYRF